MIGRLLVLSITPITWLSYASANDAFSETGIGGITIGKTDSISMVSEKLSLSTTSVEVEYEFLNTSSKSIKSLVSFPLPAVEICSEESADFGRCNDESVLGLKFDTWIDGKKSSPVRSVEQIVATDLSDRDYSELLKKNGLSRTLNEENKAKASKLLPDARGELESAGLIKWRSWCEQVLWTESKGPDGNIRYLLKGVDITESLQKLNYSCSSYPACTGWVNSLKEADKLVLAQKKWIILKAKKDLLLNWKVRKVFYWDHEFKPGISVKVKHTYQPLLGIAQSLDHVVQDRPSAESSEFCIDAPTKAAIIKRAKEIQPPGMANVYQWLEYILLSANSWSGPIRSFELTIRKRDKKELVSLCFDGLKKVDDLTFQAKLKNFSPSRNLLVLFF